MTEKPETAKRGPVLPLVDSAGPRHDFPAMLRREVVTVGTGQHHRGKRPGNLVAEIDDPDDLRRCGCCHGVPAYRLHRSRQACAVDLM